MTKRKYIRVPDYGKHVVNAAALVTAAQAELVRAKGEIAKGQKPGEQVPQVYHNIVRVQDALRATDVLFAFSMDDEESRT